MLPPDARIEVLRNLRDGDVVWVSVPPGLSDEQTDALHTSLTANVEPNITVFIMPTDYVEGIKVLDLASLVSLREIVDFAIAAHIQSTVDSDAS